MPPPTAKLTFPKSVHVRSRVDFVCVYEQGERQSDHLLLVSARRTGQRVTRLGLTVSKRAGNAVRRNVWKRLIREAFRLSRSELPSGLDLIVQPRAGAEPELNAVRRSLLSLAKRLDKKLPHETPSDPS